MPQTDLFMTCQDKLWDWCKRKKLFSSIDLSKYGLANYYLRAPRTARQWAEEGKLRRLSNQEKLFRGLVKDGNQNIAWYEVCNA